MSGAFPYPGLRPFERDETDIFFGREEHTDQLLERLGQTHFLAVVGPSGCGKSSLVRTGLLAGLETGLLLSAGAHWRMAEMRPGNRPFARLADALLVDEAIGPEYTAQLTSYFTDATETAAFLESGQHRGMLQAQLRRGPFSLHEILHSVPLPERTKLLVVVDQFEEIFRYYQQGEEDEAAAFVSLLLASSQHPDVYVVLTMRSDFIGDCALFHGLPEAINQGLFLTPRLNREQLRAAIEEPAMVFGGQIEPVLVNRLLNDAGTNPDQLPVLQHALMRMWTLGSASPSTAGGIHDGQSIRLTMDHYVRIGGLDAALSQHADEAYNELDLAQQTIAELLFRSLSERGSDRRDTRRPVALSAVAMLAQVPWPQVAAVVEVFRQEGRSFLTPPVGRVLEPDSVLDISHESLIRQWQRLQDWTTQEAEVAKLYQRLEDGACRWERGQAALWRPPELEQALAWRAQAQPTAAWAQRYGQHFDLAMRFLDASAAQQQEEQQRIEAARQRELWQARRQMTLAIIGCVIALGLALWAYSSQQLAKSSEEQALIALHQTETARQEAAVAADEAIAARQKAEKAQREAERLHLVSTAQALAAQTLARQDDRGALLARQAYIFNQRGRGHILGQIDDALRRILGTPFFSRVFQGHEGVVIPVAFSPDSQILAAGGEDGIVYLWDIHQPSAAPILLHSSGVIWSVAFSPDSQILAAGVANGTIYLWNLRQPSAAPILLSGHTQAVHSVAFSPNGRILASGSKDHTIRLWDLYQSNAPPVVLRGHTDEVQSVAFAPDGKLLASGSDDKTVRLWNLHQLGSAPSVLRGHELRVNSVAFSLDGQQLASGSHDHTIRLWNPHQPGATPIVLHGHDNTIGSVVFSPDSHMLASGSLDNTIRLWDLRQPTAPPTVLHGYESTVWSVAFSPDGERLASSSLSKTIRLWDLRRSSAALTVLRGHIAGVKSGAFSPDGQTFASSSNSKSNNKTILLWDLRSPNATPIALESHSGDVNNVAFSPGGERLASGGRDKTVRLWDLHKLDTTPIVLKDHNDAVNSVRFSPDGQRLASGSADGTVRVWDLRRLTAAPSGLNGTATALRHGGEVSSVAFSPDSQILASGSADSTIRLWDLRQADALPTILRGHGGMVMAVAYSPDAQRLASGSSDSTVHLWDLRQLSAPPLILRGHGGGVMSVAFSPDGQRLASVSMDATVRLWDLDHPSVAPVILRGHGGIIMSVAFSPDGTTLASGSLDGTIRIWVSRTESLFDKVCEEVWRNLTPEEWHQFVGIELPYERTCPNLPPGEETPAHELAWSSLVRIFLSENKFPEAIAVVKKQLAINPNDPLAWGVLGAILWKQGNVDEAATAFTKGLAVQPNDLVLLCNDAELALVQGDMARFQNRAAAALSQVTPKDEVFAIITFLTWIANPHQGWANVITAIDEFESGFQLTWDFSDISQAIARLDTATQQTAQHFIDFFQSRINLSTLKARLATR